MNKDEVSLKLERFLMKYKLLNQECPYSFEVKDGCTVWLKQIDIGDLLNNIENTKGKLTIRIPSLIDGIELDNFLRIYVPSNVQSLQTSRMQIEDKIGKVKEIEVIGTGRPIMTPENKCDFQGLYELTMFRRKENLCNKEYRLTSSKFRSLESLSFIDFDATEIREFNFGSPWQKLKRIDASGLKISKVNLFQDFGDFYMAQYGTIDWSLIDFSDLLDAMWLFRGSSITQDQFVQEGFSRTIRPQSAQFTFSSCENISRLVDIDLTRSDQQLQMYEDSNLSGILTVGKNLYPRESLQYKNADSICIIEFGKYRNTKITEVNVDGFSATYPKRYIDPEVNICMSYELMLSDCKMLKRASIRNIGIQINGEHIINEYINKFPYINISRMFEDDTSLEEVTIENVYAPLYNVDMQFLFQGCSSLKRVVFRNIVIFDIGRIMGMFDECTNIQQIEFDNVYIINREASNFSLKSLIVDWINNKNQKEIIDVGEHNTQLIDKITEKFSSGVKIDNKEHLKYKPIQLYEKCIRQ